MTKPIERAIVVILLMLCMPFLATWFTILLFGDLFVASMAGCLFLFLGLYTFQNIYKEKE